VPLFNKLVRDRIPEIIEMSGSSCQTKILNEDEYILEINRKMHEELEEYQNAETSEDIVEELADLLELIHAAAAYHGESFEEVELARVEKAERRGGFDERIFLVDVEDE
jgi:predicted house-cleaning noncanonical NTP pyrophosphatase (MazG superfamily)